MEIEIFWSDNKPYQEHHLIMLPTHEESNIIKNTYKFNPEHGNPLSCFQHLPNATDRGYEYQELYFYRKVDIKDLDAIDPTQPVLFVSSNDMIKTIVSGGVRVKTIGEYYLITATTDTRFHHSTPIIPDVFLEAFVNRWGKGFDTMLLELEEYIPEGITFGMNGNDEPPTEFRVKTSNKFVTIISPISDDRRNMDFIYNRLLYIHREDPNSDYMLNFKKLVNQTA